MNMQKNQLVSSAMTHGLMLGGGFVIVNIVFWLTDRPFAGGQEYVNYFLYIGLIYLGTVSFRKTEPGGYIKYGKALAYGALTSFFGAVIFAFWLFVLYKFIDSDLLQQRIEFTQDALLNQGMSDDMVEQQSKVMEMFMGPGIMAFGELFGKTLMGFILSLIVAIFTKKNNPDPFADATGHIED
ncbi:DUF4199 domain-containing protein [Prolixibacteraceae bacterium JC049]|nr:DUF4199 domain-containing protein [Prolixibacteraceae bacterium JC049]